jgi:hypothetical protein
LGKRLLLLLLRMPLDDLLMWKGLLLSMRRLRQVLLWLQSLLGISRLLLLLLLLLWWQLTGDILPIRQLLSLGRWWRCSCTRRITW